MACGVKTWYTISTTILVILNMESLVLSAKPQVPCYFIFGDSLVDNGNNNLLVTSAKANYPPYGIDFHGGPGRFTNGRNIADFIAELLGFDKYIPPFATAEGREIISGVNYGSGGAGIRNETGRQLGDVISFNRQLLNHGITISRMVHLLGSKKAAEKHLSKCLYHVGMGSNDYINNYLKPKYYRTSRLYSPDHYARVLIQQYSKQLRILYKFGARKVAVFGLGLIGFTPAEIEMSGLNGLARVVYINNAVQLFNGRLKLLVDDLNNDLKNAKFIYLNSTSVQSGDPSTVGIKVVDAPCCKTSELATWQCIPGKVPCRNRTEYYFWDSFHSTEIANKISASRAYRAQLSTDAYPTDIRHLVQL